MEARHIHRRRHARQRVDCAIHRRLHHRPCEYMVSQSKYCFAEKAVVDLYSKILDARPLGLIFFIFMQCLGKFCRMIDWHPLWEILDQPLKSVINQI